MLAMATTIGAAAQAQSFDCVVGGEPLSFAIDRTQFGTAIAAGEPIQRKQTTVTFGARSYVAEPFVIGGTHGFHADGLGGATAMFVVQSDGAATYSVAATGEKRFGTCEVTQ